MSIIFSNLYKAYGNKVIFDCLNLELPGFGIICLFGPSGCGKTTFARIISGLDKEFTGKIKGLGNRRISVLFQEDRLFEHLTAGGNISIINKNVNIPEFFDKIGLNGLMDSYPKELSGGMRRRLSLVRAFAFNSDIIILDEPFKGLDKLAKERIVRLIRDEFINGKKKLIILITHDEEAALSLSDSIFILDGPPMIIKKKIQTNMPPV